MFIPQRHLPAMDSLQSGLLKTYKNFKKIKLVSGKSVLLEGILQPLPEGKSFRVRIIYDFKSYPKILLPDEDFSDDRPPHTFKDGSLCLYHPKGIGAWKMNRPLSDLIPLITHWLWCFEVWKATGESRWFGEEYPHEVFQGEAPC